MKLSTERQAVVSVRVTAEVRQLIHRLAAELMRRDGERRGITDVVERGIMELARKLKVAKTE